MYKTPIQILLVEDSPSEADLLRQMVSRSGKAEWELVHFDHLSDAIDACRNSLFDVVLLNLSVPDADGLETVAEFNKAAPDIPIVVLMGVDDEDLALQALEKGAQDYLVKGQITTQLLVRAIRYAIEQRQTLKQLQECQRRYRGIFDQTCQLMGVLTPQGTVLEINQTVLNFSGAKQEDFVGLPMWETTCWNYSQETQKWLKIAIADAAEGEFVSYEVEVRGCLDVKLWIDFSLKPVKDEKGKVVLLIAEGRNIGDRKRAEAQILKALEPERKLKQLKSNFISMVFHEFRNPMTVIQGFARILQNFNHNLTEDKKTEYFEQIQTSINHILQLLDQVLLIGRTETGKLQYKPAPLDLESFCRNLPETLPLSATSQHKIAFSCQGECTQVEMDKFLLQQIFTNLLSNAIKYSPEGGNIWFDLICHNGTATFYIQDEGIGIPLQDQQNLFESFHRGSNVEQIQGTGLGLSIVKKCVDLHRGQILVKSEVGVGTTVIVSLPLNQEVQELMFRDSLTGHNGGGEGSKTVAGMVIRNLKDKGYAFKTRTKLLNEKTGVRR